MTARTCLLIRAFRQQCQLTTEDLEEDEEPSAHTSCKAHPCTTRAQMSLSSVAEHKHHDCSDEELPERSLGDVLAHCRQDEVELNHLKWDGDCPVNVAVENWGCVDQHPELTHVEVVDSCDKGHQGTHVHGRLPVRADSSRLHEEEDCGGHHGNGDDPEGDGNSVIWVEESVQVQSHGV